MTTSTMLSRLQFLLFHILKLKNLSSKRPPSQQNGSNYLFFLRRTCMRLQEFFTAFSIVINFKDIKFFILKNDIVDNVFNCCHCNLISKNHLPVWQQSSRSSNVNAYPKKDDFVLFCSCFICFQFIYLINSINVLLVLLLSLMWQKITV